MEILNKARSQLDTKRRSAGAKQSIRIKTIHILETAKRALISSLQEKLRDKTELADTDKKSREHTIKQLIHFLKDNELRVPRSNNWTEPAIPVSVLPLLAKTMQDNLQTVGEHMNQASKAAKEEDQATLELRKYMEDQYSDSHHTYKQNLLISVIPMTL